MLVELRKLKTSETDIALKLFKLLLIEDGKEISTLPDELRISEMLQRPYFHFFAVHIGNGIIGGLTAIELCRSKSMSLLFTFTTAHNKAALALYSHTVGKGDLDGVGFSYAI